METPNRRIPALFTSTLGGPKRLMVSSTAFCHAPSSVTSKGM